MEQLSAAVCFLDFVEKVHQEDPSSLRSLRKLIHSYQFIHPSQSAIHYTDRFGFVPTNKRCSIDSSIHPPSLCSVPKLNHSNQFIHPSKSKIHYSDLFGLVPTKKRGSIGIPYRKPANYLLACAKDQDQLQVKRMRINRKRKFESGKEKKNRANKIRSIDTTAIPVPVELKEKIERRGGSEIKLVIEKQLTRSDLDKGQNRLLMPLIQIKNSFLEQDEEETVERGGFAVKFLEPCGDVADMQLKIWNMNSNRNYALIKAWHKVTTKEENGECGVFEEGNTIRVWSYRIEGQLWLTIEKVALPTMEVIKQRVQIQD